MDMEVCNGTRHGKPKDSHRSDHKHNWTSICVVFNNPCHKVVKFKYCPSCLRMKMDDMLLQKVDHGWRLISSVEEVQQLYPSLPIAYTDIPYNEFYSLKHIPVEVINGAVPFDA